MKHIIKTSAESTAERKIVEQESTCPECGNSLNLPILEVEENLFKNNRKRHIYNCYKCGCQWSTDWEKCNY